MFVNKFRHFLWIWCRCLMWCCVLFSADFDKYSEDPEFKPASRHTKDLLEEVQVWQSTFDSSTLIYLCMFWNFVCSNVFSVFSPQPDSMNVDDEVSVEDRLTVLVPEHAPSQSGACDWPSSSSLTARMRRLITAYQRSYRQEQLKMEAEAKGDRRRRRCEQASKLKEIARQERQQRWTALL